MRTDGQTDRHEEPNSRFSQICERAQETVTWSNLAKHV